MYPHNVKSKAVPAIINVITMITIIMLTVLSLLYFKHSNPCFVLCEVWERKTRCSSGNKYLTLRLAVFKRIIYNSWETIVRERNKKS